MYCYHLTANYKAISSNCCCHWESTYTEKWGEHFGHDIFVYIGKPQCIFAMICTSIETSSNACIGKPCFISAIVTIHNNVTDLVLDNDMFDHVELISHDHVMSLTSTHDFYQSADVSHNTWPIIIIVTRYSTRVLLIELYYFLLQYVSLKS